MKKITFLSIILVLITTSNISSQEIIFEDNFESYTVGTFPSNPWFLKWEGNGVENQIVVNNQSVSPTQSLKLECAPNWAANAQITLPITPTIINCEGYLMIKDLSHRAHMGFKNPDVGTWGTYYARVVVGDNGNITCEGVELQPGEANKWYHIRIRYNSIADVCDVWIDGILKGKDIECSTEGEYNAFTITAGHPSLSVKAWFDDVKVYTDEHLESTGWTREGYDLGWSYQYPFDTDTLIQNIPFGMDWMINAEIPLVLTGDITGNGLPEIIYTSNNTLFVFDGNGNELWSITLNFIEPNLPGILEDVTGDGIQEIIIGTRHNTTLKLLIYDGSGNLIKEINESDDVSGDNHIYARAVTDIDNDGDLELVASRSSGYNLWSRGVEVFDYASGNRKWFYSIGPQPLALNIADITGDQNKEIIFGTRGPANGHNVNGFTDNRCYAICLDKDGNLLWSREFEGSGFVDSEVSVVDLDGDNKNEVIYTSRAHGWQWWDGDIGRIYLLNPDNGEIIKEYNAANPLIVNGIADIIGDDKKEILVNYQDASTQTGKILMFDDSLNLLQEYVVSGSILRVCAINDLNGDGRLETIVRKMMANEFVVLDENLNELWSLSFPDEVKDVIPTDLDNDGINDLIVSTENTLQVRKWKFTPSFTNILYDQVACKKDKVVFEVIAEGIPPIYYQWQKDGLDIPGATDSVFIIPNVQMEDGGEYHCIATNVYGSDTSNSASLSIEFEIPTVIVGHASVSEYQIVLYSVSLEEGHNYEFIVEGGNIIDESENTISVHWGSEGQGFIHLIEQSELGCYADTNTLSVTIGYLGVDDHETQDLSISPNPFTNITSLEFKSTETDNIKINIYNQLGELIETIQKTTQPGKQTFTWDANGLPSGVYFMRLKKGNEIITKKLVKL